MPGQGPDWGRRTELVVCSGIGIFLWILSVWVYVCELAWSDVCLCVCVTVDFDVSTMPSYGAHDGWQTGACLGGLSFMTTLQRLMTNLIKKKNIFFAGRRCKLWNNYQYSVLSSTYYYCRVTNFSNIFPRLQFKFKKLWELQNFNYVKIYYS